MMHIILKWFQEHIDFIPKESNRAPMGCCCMGNSPCNEFTAIKYNHLNMDQDMKEMFPTACGIHGMKKQGKF